jgi:hypothetical protein
VKTATEQTALDFHVEPAPRLHLLTVGPPRSGKYPLHRYCITCPGVTDVCRWWVPCEECDPEDVERLERDGQDWAHGLAHQYGEDGWLAPTPHCFVQHTDQLPQAVAKLRLRPRVYPAVYLVDFRFTDEGCLELLHPQPVPTDPPHDAPCWCSRRDCPYPDHGCACGRLCNGHSGHETEGPR